MTHTILALTVLFGVLASSLSAWLFIYFAKSRKRVARAVAFMLLGETTANVVFTCFASMSLMGVLPDIHVLVQTAMRWIALLIVSASSIHLAAVIRKVQD